MDDKENLFSNCPFILPVPANVVGFVNAFNDIIKNNYHDFDIIRHSIKNINLEGNQYYNNVKSIDQFKSYLSILPWTQNDIIAICVYYKYKGYMPYCIKDGIVYLYKYDKSNNKIYQNKVKLSRFLYIIGGKEVIQDANNLKHTLLSDADDIEYAYKNISKSCMSNKFLHSRAYADNDKLSIMVIHTFNSWKLSAKVRLVVNTKTKTYCRFYSNGDLTNSTITNYLSKLGYNESKYTLDNCTLKLIFKQSFIGVWFYKEININSMFRWNRTYQYY